MNISAVILNYNGYNDTVACVNSLRMSHYPCHIIVVDNASDPSDCYNLGQYLMEGEKLICSESNGGYSGGMNIGIDYAFKNGADAVFVLNNDIIVDAQCVQHLAATLQDDPGIGILGPKILYYNRPQIIHCAGMIGDLSGRKNKRIGQDLADSGQFEDVVPTHYQEGSALMITRACFEQIGGFDTALWSYWEDTDICLRARQAQFKVVCNQSAKIWHKISASFGAYYDRVPRSVYYRARNRFIIYRRYSANRSAAVKAILRSLIRSPGYTVKLLARSKRYRAANSGAYWLAIWDGLTSDVTRPPRRYLPPV